MEEREFKGARGGGGKNRTILQRKAVGPRPRAGEATTRFLKTKTTESC